jgi:GAF domain-containing protein
MRRRVATGGKAGKQARRKGAKSRSVGNRASKQVLKVTQLRKQLGEAMQQQAATADVLRAIAGSPTDLKSVLDTLVESAARLCDADRAFIFQRSGNVYVQAANHGFSRDFEKFARQNPIKMERGTITGRVAVDGKTVHVADVLNDPEYTGAQYQTRGHYRTGLGVPLLRAGKVIGVFFLSRSEVRPFTQKQIELVTTFADQALIAIENTRLFNETKEALERQTATADILKVISQSPTDVRPVFEAIAQRSNRLLDGHSTTVYRFIHDMAELVAFTPVNPAADAVLRAAFPMPLAENRLFELVSNGEVAQIRDVEIDSPTLQVREIARARGFRSVLLVPLTGDRGPIGLISVTRREVGTFADHHVQLLQTFADQAAIAIQNVRLFDEVQAKTRDLTETLQQQTATAEVLKVISRTVFDLDIVLKTLIQSAAQLCEAERGILFLRKANECHVATNYGFSPELETYARAHPIPIDGGSTTARAAASGIAIQTVDLLADPKQGEVARQYQRLGGHRTNLGVPLKRNGEVIGVFTLTRRVVRAFTEKQIELVQTFADQAVIAIENARLVTEQREALEQQKATAEVLQVINSSPGNLAPVFDAILEKAHGLCAVTDGSLQLYDGKEFRAVAVHGLSDAFADRLRRGYVPGPNHPSQRLLMGERYAQAQDMSEVDEPLSRIAFELSGIRTALFIALRKDSRLLGQIVAARREVRPFSGKEIALLENFAAQAVIAMENARLFGELRDRQAELARSVDELTATSDVLKIISQSTVDLNRVLDTLVETAARLCQADQARMFRRHGDRYLSVASHGYRSDVEEWLSRNPQPATGRGTAIARAATERRTVQIADVLADPEYSWHEGQRVAGYRTMLAVPLLRGETLIGLFALARKRVAPFTEKEVELVTTFADQAVIAIENARLFEELRDRQAELRVTFDNMLDGVAMFDADARLAAWNRNFQAILDLPDAVIAQRPNYAEYIRILAERGEFGTDGVDAELNRLLHDTDRELRLERTRPDGRIIEVRRNPVPGGGFVLIYSDVTESKRAEQAIRVARDAAETALHDLRAAQDRLIQTEKLASLGQLTAGIAHEIKNPLNFVNNFSALSVELVDEMTDLLRDAALDERTCQGMDELRETLKSNLERVVQHGKRADSIVKNMLLHSRSGSGEHRLVEINTIIDESLNLAYHGARAERQGFNISLVRDLDPAAGVADIYPQEITRVLLNLISNGFYAATRRAAAAGDGFEPRLNAQTRNLGDTVEIRIRDNGMGISPEIREKIFDPFFTTKPAGEGTGLGLSMSHDIVVKQHGGTIEVATEPGSFTEFVIKLPRFMQVAVGQEN